MSNWGNSSGNRGFRQRWSAISGRRRAAVLAALFLIMAALLAGSPAEAQDRFYSLQVSAFQDPVKAKAEVDSLKAWGLEAFGHTEEVEGRGLWHRVYVGKFQDKASAATEGEKLKAEGIISDYVVRDVDLTRTAAAPPEPEPEPETEPTPAAAGGDSPFEDENIGPAAGDTAGTTAAASDENPFVDEPAGPAATPTDEPVAEEPLTPAGDATADAGTTQPEPAPEPPAKEPESKLPPGLPPDTVPADPPPDSWIILIDLSGSTAETFGCSGFSKQEAQFTVLRKANTKIPDLEYQAVLRQFAYKRAWSREDYSQRVYGPTKFNRQDFQGAITALKQSDAITPLGWSIASVEKDLEEMPGLKALIIVSDFKHNRADFGQPVDTVERMTWKHKDNLKVYTICSSVGVDDIRLAKALASTGNGKFYDGCRLIKDETYFDVMVAEIFGVHFVPPEPVCVDEDGDTICDDKDQCPNTPKGAPVDNRGCWITAFSQFFDFDKAVVKDEFLPRIKSSAEIIINNPHLDILIAGHTDSKGSDEYNMKLGQRRADAVRDKLVEFGVPEERLTTRSFGEGHPIADNDTDEGRAQNRRVELHVWEKGAAPPEALTVPEGAENNNQ